MNDVCSNDSSRDMFSRGTLELTFRILRKRRPALALRVQNAMVGAYGHGNHHTGLVAMELPLGDDVVEQVVRALALLSERMIADGDSERAELVLTRSLLLDWLMLARSRRESD